MSRIAPQSAFDILGVTPSDDFATIRRTWIRLVKENHPDVVGGDIEELTRKLARLNDAYDSLRWHSPDKVRIREQEASRQAHGGEPQSDDPQPRRAEPGRHPQRSGATERREAFERHPSDPPSAAQAPSGATARRGCVWSCLDAADATALYIALRGICTSDPWPPGPRRQVCL
ncbi:J domain-containing protein [Maliponia aquimaris]|uniref:DnaJ domain protein n=1 Tax=Maliponia aquimaris TaxID=1673631 RepID=A0A238KBT9_9RHOB|nr:J domain-containing protein [Maliponia aquimaris]SMX40275.1 DnaJ domain protein [Maliponia aquimaris]